MSDDLAAERRPDSSKSAATSPPTATSCEAWSCATSLFVTSALSSDFSGRCSTRLLLMIIFVIIFSELFRFKIVHYDIYFLSAFIAWNFFSQSTVGAMTSLGWNGQLMKQVRAPKTIFALATTISGLVNLVLSMFPLLLIMWWVKAPIRISILFLPISFVVLAMFTLGVSLAVSSLSVFFVDVREMYTVGLTALMYLTPIIYPLDIIPEKFLWIVKPNPLRYMLETIRAPIYYGIIPPLRTVLIALGLRSRRSGHRMVDLPGGCPRGSMRTFEMESASGTGRTAGEH